MKSIKTIGSVALIAAMLAACSGDPAPSTTSATETPGASEQIAPIMYHDERYVEQWWDAEDETSVAERLQWMVYGSRNTATETPAPSTDGKELAATHDGVGFYIPSGFENTGAMWTYEDADAVYSWSQNERAASLEESLKETSTSEPQFVQRTFTNKAGEYIEVNFLDDQPDAAGARWQWGASNIYLNGHATAYTAQEASDLGAPCVPVKEGAQELLCWYTFYGQTSVQGAAEPSMDATQWYASVSASLLKGLSVDAGKRIVSGDFAAALSNVIAVERVATEQ